MRSLRKQLRPLLLASVQAALTGCYQPPAARDHTSSSSGSSLGTTSASGTTGSGSTSTGSSSGSTIGLGATGSTGSASTSATGSTGTGSTGSTASSSTGSTGSTGNVIPACDGGNWFCGAQCNQQVSTPALDGGLSDGGLDQTNCWTLCQPLEGQPSSWYPESCELVAESTSSAGTTWEVSCQMSQFCGGGRRPEGMEPAESSGAGLGNYFAQMAHLEAASVGAFRRLERELAAHGAPQALRARARAAAREEVAHARQMARLAVQHGASVPKVRAAPAQLRSLQELAMENAVEGCVRETYGAALAAYQARTAPDAEARAAFARIADEEAGHAELAWAVDAWAQSRLDAEGRAALARARAEAARELARSLDAPPSPALAPAGVPGPAQARALFDSLAAPLWS